VIGYPPSRTHDLAELAAASASGDPTFADLDTAARMLTPYAVQFRYPDMEQADPSEAETREAIELARRISDFVAQRLPASVLP
jgi:HEPN domain-containing protein